MRRLVLSTLVLLAVPGAAGAATPFNAGTGADARVAVSEDGTGHVVFTIAGDPDKVGYCRAPRAGTACDVTHTLSFPGPGDHQGGQSQVFAPAPGKVVVIGACWACAEGSVNDRVMRWTSTDNGATFSEPVALTPPGTAGGTGFDTRDGNGLWLDAEELFVGIGGDKLMALPAAGNDPVIHSAFGTNYGPEVQRIPGTNRLVSLTNDLANITFSVYDGTSLAASAINTQAKWTGPFELPSPEGDNEESGLVSGPAGLFAHYRFFGATNTRVGLRRFDPATLSFGAPVYVDGENPVDDNSLDYPDAFQDASGRIHAVWRTLHDEGRLRYTVSDATGTSFSTPGTLAARETIIDPEVGAASDGSGFAVWTGIGQSLVRVVPLDPAVEPAPDPVAPGFGSDPGAGSSAKKKGKKVKFKTAGTLVVPAGTVCAGKVRITVKRGKKRIARKSAPVASDCSYSRKIKLKRKKVKRAKKLKVTLEFIPAAGSGLAPSKTTFKLRIR